MADNDPGKAVGFDYGSTDVGASVLSVHGEGDSI